MAGYRMRRGTFYQDKRSLWRMAADFGVMLSLAALILYATNQIAPFIVTGDARVIDGDTLKEGSRRIRLEGIDAPEIDQRCRNARGSFYACGEKARLVLSDLIAGQKLMCQTMDRDRYRRAVSVCRAGLLEVNREMVRLGWAIAYQPHTLQYVREEIDARIHARGLWQGTFERPQSYRKMHRRTFWESATGFARLWDEPD